MLPYPHIDPIAFSLGPIQVHWYGLMYLIGFGLAWLLGRLRAKQSNGFWQPSQVDDIIFYCAMGIIVGGRLGYVLFYHTASFWEDPLFIFRIWEGGMAFHGGLIGVIAAMALFARQIQRPLLQVTDFVAPLVPLGLAFGRLGNFINGELWGRVTDVPWGMVFPYAGSLPRHPSQLYESFLEGVVLFIILWLYSNKPRPMGRVSGLFVLGYGTFRFIIEFFREPDIQLGLLGIFSMGQWLSLPLIVVGLWLMTRRENT